MTEITIYTNSDEVNDVYENLKRYLIRSDKIKVKKGDVINLRLIKNQKEVYHQINRKKYLVTKVEDYKDVPIYWHNQIISIREIR